MAYQWMKSKMLMFIENPGPKSLDMTLKLVGCKNVTGILYNDYK